MATFRIPRPVNQELGGNSDELVGKLVALRPEGTVTVNTSFGSSPAARVTAVSVTESGYEAMGLRLIFWSEVRKALKALPEGEWIVGTITSVPQANHPDRTVYVIEAPEEDSISMLSRALDAYETDERLGRV